ncbi:hypothetical protein LIER_23287 [Lithospermum erythrorhizon]|uniref:Reverse transcriptase domain-containing protein n=1 Tax=Lithospermum erythrorhizon TaxID=34254 RepID=A0AAV3QZ68_LITER
MEIYVDDILINSWEAEDHEANLRESFENVRRNKVRLNPDKCFFGVTSGKFVGYMISQGGIEPNPVVLTTQEVPPIPTVVGLTSAGDVLQRYCAVSESSLSSVLVRDEAKVQRPVYYVSRVMRGADTSNPSTDKLVYALVVAPRKLKPYFEARPVEVGTVVEWVEEEAFRTKEVMNNDAPEGGVGGVLGVFVPGGLRLLEDRGLTRRSSGG